MRNWLSRLNIAYIIFSFLCLLLVTQTLPAIADTEPANSEINSIQESTRWCFSRLEDREREVGYYLPHPENISGEALLDAYAMPVQWLESLAPPICQDRWELEFLEAAEVSPRPFPSEITSFDEEMRKRYGTPWVGIIDIPILPANNHVLESDEIWCYTYFQQDGTNGGVFLGHFPGLEPEKVLARYANSLDMTQSWTERGSECFSSWQLARSFTYYVMKENIRKKLPLYGQGEFFMAQSVMTVYGTPQPAHSLLAPSRRSALLDPNAKPRWCYTIFTGGEGSTAAFGHYPDLTVNEVLIFYHPPAWVKDLAGQQETNCYTSWEAAFRSRPLEWKQGMMVNLPASPEEGDFEIIVLKGSFSDRWREYQRPEFSTEGTPDPLILTRMAPTPTITSTPTPTATTDPRTISSNTAVWCFTHVEDRAHDLVFYVGHPPDMSLNDIRKTYNLPPGLLSQPDRETFCYENWGEAAIFVRGNIDGPTFTFPGGNPSTELFQEYQNTIEQNFGTLLAGSIQQSDTRYLSSFGKPDQLVWCYSYFTDGNPNAGIYLGHYVEEGDESILTDYGQDTSGRWKRIDINSQCFTNWYKAGDAYTALTGKQLLFGKFNIQPFDYALTLITMREPIEFSGEPIFAATPTTALTPTAARLPSSAALLDTTVPQAVWCYTLFTGGSNSTASFGHYPGMTTEEIFTLYKAPDWVKDLAGQQETNCYASWAAAFEGLSPPALKLTLAPYLPDAPAEADFETVILWSYFKTQWQDYKRSEFSAVGTPQDITLTRVAPTPTITPTPTRSPDELAWCFNLYYDDTTRVSDLLVGYYPGMDDADILELHGFSEDYFDEHTGRKTACFYSYTDAIRFQQAIFEGEYLIPLRLTDNETENQLIIKNRYIKQTYDSVSDLERAQRVFDEGLFTQPRNDEANLPTRATDAPLLDTTNRIIWCATYFRTPNKKLLALGHYPGTENVKILETYRLTGTFTQEKQVCYNSWKEAANTEYYRTDYLDAPNYNEADYELLVLEHFFTTRAEEYRRPEFSAKVTPQVFQTPLAISTATPTTPPPPSAATLLDGNDFARWCYTIYINPQGQKGSYGHYPDINAADFLMANGIKEIEATNCYSTWQAAAESLSEQDRAALELPSDPTETDYETAQLRYYFGEFFWEAQQRKEFSAGVLPEGFTPENIEKLVWCRYTIAKKNSIAGRDDITTNVDNYPDMTVEEVLISSIVNADWVNDEPTLQTLTCYKSWKEAMQTLFADGLEYHRANLPETLTDGDYEVLVLWFRFTKGWKQQQRPEFSADEPPNPAVIEYVES